jgi:hypothetical protein
MQCLEVSGAVRPICESLGFKGLNTIMLFFSNVATETHTAAVFVAAAV